ncbi:MAG: DUF1684 domain-containing protein [Saprospiraceae bacterium]|nr:DUF1684 domain-containing protein [Saprospiraceae bacterium]
MLLLAMTATLGAQTASKPYAKAIAKHRKEYRKDFLTNERSPLKNKEDLKALRFYEPDERYRVEATVEVLEGEEPFDMATYAGTTKPYIRYARLKFELLGQQLELTLYRNLQLVKMPQYRDHLFLPFMDATNGEATYGGGRYMDFKITDIAAGKMTIDFNKAYNPWCAFSDGYQCPIPPFDNHLGVAIEAGELQFGKEKKHQ